MLLIEKRNKTTQAEWDTFLEKCLPQMETQLIKVLTLSEGHAGNKVIHKSKNRAKMLLKVFNQALKKENKDKAQFYFERQKMFVQFQVPEGDILKIFLELDTALKINNFSWAKKMLGEIAILDQLNFTLNPLTFDTEEDKKAFFNNLFSVFHLAKRRLGIDNKDLQYAVINLSQLMNNLELENLKKELDGDWSLAELRERIKKGFDIQYIGFFYKLLLNRASDVESKNFLNTHLTKEVIEIMPYQLFFLFKEYLPVAQSVREEIIKRMKIISNKKTFYARYLTIVLLRNPLLKRNLKEKGFERANFKLEREFFRDVLQQGVAVDFCLYHLVRLGDYDDRLLWWIFSEGIN